MSGIAAEPAGGPAVQAGPEAGGILGGGPAGGVVADGPEGGIEAEAG